jgi:hypothetical protein
LSVAPVTLHRSAFADRPGVVVVKLIVREQESAALVAVLERDDDTLITSEIGFVELARVGARVGVPPIDIAAVRETFVAMPLDGPVRQRAQDIDPSSLRSFDAIHSRRRCRSRSTG